MTRDATRVAMVTGGTRGIGRAIATRFARGGVIPVVIYRQDDARAQEAIDALRAIEPRARSIKADLAVAEEAARAVAETTDALGAIDILVNNAFRGGRPPKKVHEIDPQAFSDDLTSNLVGPFLITRAVLPGMIARGAGRIIFIGSLAMHGERGRAAYVVAKNGLVGLARAVAAEYAPSGITANVVAPGYIEAGAFLALDPAVREAALKRVPMKRLGTAEEIAELVWYLGLPAAGYVTGQVIGIDGGAR